MYFFIHFTSFCIPVVYSSLYFHDDFQLQRIGRLTVKGENEKFVNDTLLV